jgi:hypothetical protein
LLLYSSYLPLGVSQLAGHLLHHHRAIIDREALILQVGGVISLVVVTSPEFENG